jgi:extracellular factor (EF) 3-hydroxypalmitic acid methyl ester biosynthesis protein
MISLNTENTIPAETTQFLTSLMKKGGPEPHEDQTFSDIVNNLKKNEVDQFRKILGEALNENTLIGHGLLKPYGYPGDFSIIHNIYRFYVNPDPRYTNWDRFFQNQAGAHAVRNRKEFFLRCCKNLEESHRKDIKVLILGCGPATDVNEYMAANPDSRITFDLIDFDQTAIDFARKQNDRFNGNIEYFRINVLRYKPYKWYDLIWSSGLFDYFRDKHFIYLINKYHKYLADGGEYIIGNFSHVNPTKKLMEILSDWYLNHRSRFDLMRVAIEAEAAEEKIRVDSEELGVNLFLRIKQSVNGFSWI